MYQYKKVACNCNCERRYKQRQDEYEWNNNDYGSSSSSSPSPRRYVQRQQYKSRPKYIVESYIDKEQRYRKHRPEIINKSPSNDRHYPIYYSSRRKSPSWREESLVYNDYPKDHRLMRQLSEEEAQGFLITPLHKEKPNKDTALLQIQQRHYDQKNFQKQAKASRKLDYASLTDTDSRAMLLERRPVLQMRKRFTQYDDDLVQSEGPPIHPIHVKTRQKVKQSSSRPQERTLEEQKIENQLIRETHSKTTIVTRKVSGIDHASFSDTNSRSQLHDKKLVKQMKDLWEIKMKEIQERKLIEQRRQLKSSQLVSEERYSNVSKKSTINRKQDKSGPRDSYIESDHIRNFLEGDINEGDGGIQSQVEMDGVQVHPPSSKNEVDIKKYCDKWRNYCLKRSSVNYVTKIVIDSRIEESRLIKNQSLEILSSVDANVAIQKSLSRLSQQYYSAQEELSEMNLKEPSPDCQSCRKQIYIGKDQYLKENGFFWHINCFKCETCNIPLNDKNYYIMDGNRLLCSVHYSEALKTPTCSGCHQHILENTYTEAMGSFWHKNHFKCSNCHNPIINRKFVNKNGKAICFSCQKEHFSNMCENCGLLIEPIDQFRFIPSDGSYQYATNKCFYCPNCGISLTEKS